MATVILRPTADVSLKHSCSSGSSGYALINEATSDGDSAYIYQTVNSTTSTEAASEFKCSATSAGKFQISSVTLTINAKTTKGDSSDTASIRYTIRVEGRAQSAKGSSTLSTSYGNFTKTASASDLGVAGLTYDSFDVAYFTVYITTAGAKNKSKNDDFQNRITQVYLTVEYTPVSDTDGTGIYIKQNGAYTQAQAAYKKVSGVWVQQTDTAALKTEIQSGRYKHGG